MHACMPIYPHACDSQRLSKLYSQDYPFTGSPTPEVKKDQIKCSVEGNPMKGPSLWDIHTNGLAQYRDTVHGSEFHSPEGRIVHNDGEEAPFAGSKLNKIAFLALGILALGILVAIRFAILVR